jgi:rRNA maturation RNase YbeY
MNSVRFFYNGVKLSLTDRSRLKAFIPVIFKKNSKKLGSLNYIFCSDKFLLDMNRQFLTHDYYTDIITFDTSEDKTLVSGEIYISVDRVRDNAGQIGASFKEELHRVIFHGALHLCGYRDKSPAEKKQMRKQEELYINTYFKY